MSDPLSGKSPVGYRRPPAEHKFTKGKSGNPRGRPPNPKAAKTRSTAATQLEDILMAEALRPIQVRENDQVVEMPMIQAVIRSMGVAAVKGSHKAQTTLANMVQSVQAKRHEELVELFKTVVEYKESWQAHFEDCDRRGEPRPEPVPHPDELVVDLNTLRVKYNGPFTPDDKAHWDMLLERKKDALQDIDEMRREMKRNKKHTAFYEEDIAFEQKLADMIGGVVPDEQTRRAPGFDLEEWRERKGVLAELRKRGQRRLNKR